MIRLNTEISSKKSLIISAFTLLLLASCGKDNPVDPVAEPNTEEGNTDDSTAEEGDSRQLFTLALSASPTGETKVYTQALEDVGAGVVVSYDGVGYEMPSTRTARIFSSQDGTSVYNLDYGGGRVYKFSVDGGEDYQLQTEKNVEFAMGTAYPRWTKANEASASIHYADGSNARRVYQYTDSTLVEGNYVYTDSTFVRSDVTLRVMTVGLEDLSFGSIEEITIPVSDTDLASHNYVGRVDAPVIAGDKIYYGLSKSAYDPENPCSGRGCPKAVYTNTETLVLDYPSLTNPRIIATEMAAGATNGYRTPVSYLDEKGDVYQIITVPDNTYDTYILKISDGTYDESFRFNLSELLGENTKSYGWFYVGDGIGYVPYLRTDETASSSDSNWSVARVDLYNGTAIKMNLPESLWLTQYQSGVVKDGKFYMAITPTGENGNVYIFDTTSESADGFTLGATLNNLAEGTYIGIY